MYMKKTLCEIIHRRVISFNCVYVDKKIIILNMFIHLHMNINNMTSKQTSGKLQICQEQQTLIVKFLGNLPISA